WEAYGEPVALAEVTPGTQATVLVDVERIAAKRTPRRRMQLTEAVVRDDSGERLAVVWFNQPYIARQIRAGDRLALAGLVRASRFGPGLEMQNPHHELVGREGGPRRIGGLMPKYHLSGGLTSRRVAGWVEAVLPLADQLEDVIPEETRGRQHLLPV